MILKSKSTLNVENYPNIGKGFLKKAAEAIREINGQKKKQNRA